MGLAIWDYSSWEASNEKEEALLALINGQTVFAERIKYNGINVYDTVGIRRAGRARIINRSGGPALFIDCPDTGFWMTSWITDWEKTEEGLTITTENSTYRVTLRLPLVI